ncbi:winged helix-turn-helix transcriptional regulator [Streptomyces sp. SBST2-5]|uniref:Winged helix-turn-helix transcriptional regulator n=1 Tax=Streptomyces composti TaxID=2720025 RepID=A0ABX1AD82_9ACTN|nr:winged helix-turn-helix domain-containing protein [Streptomyces composti]NJP52614.1 winged helix-turn-helix transcriptional regulator [Streptomyces composti]
MVVAQDNVAVNGSRRLSPQEIADILRERIRTGELKAGDRLPTQAELAEEFGVERGTVRQALRALQQDGLLSNVSKGSPPRIAEPPPAREEPRPTMVALAPRLTEAFSAPHVRVDVVCHTSETLMLALGEPLRLIHEGRIRPESIDFRVLLPSRKINLAFPVLAEQDAGEAEAGPDPVPDPVHERWLQMRNAQAQVLDHNLRAFRSTHGIDVQVRFRALPFTPPNKLYLLNQEEALLGYYMLVRREEEWGSRTLDMYDVLGSKSLLFSFVRQAGPRDAAFVEESQKWFDALWETITSDLTLS